jgi:S1-C subfamily serine protease
MSVLAKCPQCGHQFGVPDKYAGKRGKCPQCSHLFRAPTLEEDIADWGSEIEQVGPPVATPQPPVDTAPPVAKLAGRPKAPLPKVLADVTPPPAPVAPEAVANQDAELPDLASLSEPAGPTAAPPVAPLAQPAEDLPDLSSISEDPIPVAGPATPSAPVVKARPSAPQPADAPSSPGKKPAAAAGPLGPDIDTGPAVDTGPTVGTGSARKRRASDVFDPQELAAKLGQAEAKTARQTPSGEPPQEAARAAAPVDRPAAKKPAASKPSGKPTAKAAAATAAPGTKPSGAKRAKPLPTAEPLKTATPAAKPQAKKPVEKTADSKPLPQKEESPSEAAALAAAIATEGEVGQRPSGAKGPKRPAKKPWLLIGVGGALAAVVLLIVVGFAISPLLSSGEADVTVGDGETELPDEEVATIRDAEGGGSAAGAAASAELSASQWDAARKAVVRLEVLTDDSKEIGTGFLIEPQGWVATAYSLIQHGTSASVVTYEGRHLVEGTVATDPELDLAILKLESPGNDSSLPTLPVYDGPNRVKNQTAYVFRDYSNSRLDSSRGEAQRSLPMSEMRPALRPYLPERARENGLLNFIEINGRVTGTAHGGPLVNGDGQVLGVCIYLGESSRFSYAIHAKHLVELMASAGHEVKPLTPDVLARSDQPDRPGGVTDKDETESNGADASAADGADDPESAAKKDPFDEPYEGPSEPTEIVNVPPTAPPADDPFAEPQEITAEKLEKALEVCEDLRFVVATEEEYANLQDLAFLLTKVQELADDESVPNERREKLKAAAEKVTSRLANVPWVDVGGINKLAVTALANPHRGTFLYVTMMGSQPNVAPLGGRNIILFKTIDAERLVVMPTKAEIAEFPRGSRWLLVGVHNPHPPTRFRMPDGQFAEFIDAKYVIGEPQE